MDRHQFVKELIVERDQLKEQVANLKNDRDKARRRTRESVSDLLNPKPITPSSLTLLPESGFTFSVVGPGPPREDEQVSDYAIKNLCGEISSLKKEVETICEQTKDYNSRDFVAQFKALLDTLEDE